MNTMKTVLFAVVLLGAPMANASPSSPPTQFVQNIDNQARFHQEIAPRSMGAPDYVSWQAPQSEAINVNQCNCYTGDELSAYVSDRPQAQMVIVDDHPKDVMVSNLDINYYKKKSGFNNCYAANSFNRNGEDGRVRQCTDHPVTSSAEKGNNLRVNGAIMRCPG